MNYLILWNYLSRQGVVRYASVTHLSGGNTRNLADTLYKDNEGAPITYNEVDDLPIPAQVIPLELLKGSCILHWKHYDESGKFIRFSTERVQLDDRKGLHSDLIISREATRLKAGEDSSYRVCVQISPL